MSNAEAVKKSRAKAGVKPTSFSFTPDEMTLLDRVAARFGGQKKAAVIAGLIRLDETEPSLFSVIADLEQIRQRGGQ